MNAETAEKDKKHSFCSEFYVLFIFGIENEKSYVENPSKQHCGIFSKMKYPEDIKPSP